MLKIVIGSLIIVIIVFSGVVYFTKIKPVAGKACGGIVANLEAFQCPKLFVCNTDASLPDTTGTCVFAPFSAR